MTSDEHEGWKNFGPRMSLAVRSTFVAFRTSNYILLGNGTADNCIHGVRHYREAKERNATTVIDRRLAHWHILKLKENSTHAKRWYVTLGQNVPLARISRISFPKLPQPSRRLDLPMGKSNLEKGRKGKQTQTPPEKIFCTILDFPKISTGWLEA